MPLRLVWRAGEFRLDAARDVTRDHAAVRREMRERGRVLVADPERAVGQAHEALGVDAAQALLQELAFAVERGLGGGVAQRQRHAVQRAAVTILQRDDIGDAERTVVEQQNAIDRRRVGRRRIDAAVLDRRGRSARSPAIAFMSLHSMFGPRSPTVHSTLGGSLGWWKALEPMPTVRLSVLPPSNAYGAHAKQRVVALIWVRTGDVARLAGPAVMAPAKPSRAAKAVRRRRMCRMAESGSVGCRTIRLSLATVR